jgi:hypothetical protein
VFCLFVQIVQLDWTGQKSTMNALQIIQIVCLWAGLIQPVDGGCVKTFYFRGMGTENMLQCENVTSVPFINDKEYEHLNIVNSKLVDLSSLHSFRMLKNMFLQHSFVAEFPYD